MSLYEIRKDLKGEKLNNILWSLVDFLPSPRHGNCSLEEKPKPEKNLLHIIVPGQIMKDHVLSKLLIDYNGGTKVSIRMSDFPPQFKEQIEKVLKGKTRRAYSKEHNELRAESAPTDQNVAKNVETAQSSAPNQPRITPEALEKRGDAARCEKDERVNIVSEANDSDEKPLSEEMFAYILEAAKIAARDKPWIEGYLKKIHNEGKNILYIPSGLEYQLERILEFRKKRASSAENRELEEKQHKIVGNLDKIYEERVVLDLCRYLAEEAQSSAPNQPRITPEYLKKWDRKRGLGDEIPVVEALGPKDRKHEPSCEGEAKHIDKTNKDNAGEESAGAAQSNDPHHLRDAGWDPEAGYVAFTEKEGELGVSFESLGHCELNLVEKSEQSEPEKEGAEVNTPALSPSTILNEAQEQAALPSAQTEASAGK